MIFEYLMAGGVAGTGLGVGWWLRGTFFPAAASDSAASPVTVAEASKAASDVEAAKVESQESIQAREVLAKLHELAARVAADVGAHAKSVRDINNDLRGPGGGNANDVLAAVDRLISTNEQMQNQLKNAENKLAEQARELEEQSAAARTDALTGLANRRALDLEIKRRVAEAARQGRRVSLMMIDVDHFKKFNDTHGHQAGDAVLKNVGAVLAKAAREMDFVARYGGEEFAVLFPSTSLGEARKAGERMRQAITDSELEFQGITLRVTSSAGVAQLLPGETGDSALRRADEALYAAKKSGRNRGCYHDGSGIHPLIGEASPAAPPQPRVEAAPVAEAVATATAAVPPAATPSPAPAKLKIAPPAGASVGVSSQDLAALANRISFCEDVQRRVAEWKRGGATVSVALLQIDKFADFAARGDSGMIDLILRATVQFTKASMRDMDHMARFDDATFALLLPGATIQAANRVAERLRTAVEKARLKYQTQTLQFTISCGAVEVNEHDDSEKLIRRAETALDDASRQGGNRTILNKPEVTSPVTAK